MSTYLKKMKTTDPIYPPSSCLDDPIIQQMLSFRPIDNTDPNEVERINRMASMLRNSKKYKRLSIVAANKQWDSFMDESSDLAITVSNNRRRVTFSDIPQIITSPTLTKRSFLHQLKSQFHRIKRIL